MGKVESEVLLPPSRIGSSKQQRKHSGRKLLYKNRYSSLSKSLLTFFSFLASCKHTKNKQISQKFKRLSFFLFAFKILVYRNRRAKGKSLVQRQAVGLGDKINFGNKKVSLSQRALNVESCTLVIHTRSSIFCSEQKV